MAKAGSATATVTVAADGGTEPTRGRVPIFVRVLLTFVGLLVVTVGVLVGLSVREFRKDKEVYVLDFASQVAEGLALQIDSFLDGERQKMLLMGLVLRGPRSTEAERTRDVEAMLVNFKELIRLEIVPATGEPIRVHNVTHLRALGFASSESYVAARLNGPDAREVAEGALIITPQFFGDEKIGLTLSLRTKELGLVSADIYAPKVTDFFTTRGATEIFLIDGSGRALLHPDVGRLRKGLDLSGSELVREALKASLASARPFRDEAGVPFLGGYAPVPSGKLAVVSQVPQARAYAAARRLVTVSMGASIVLLLAMSALAAVAARNFAGPLVRMAKATEKIATGDFRVLVPVSRRDEFGDLARSLNSMSAELLRRDKRLAEAQGALVESEKMAAFGQLSAGIAHEVKNPLAGILGFVELATGKVKPEDPVSRYLGMIDKETRRCNDIIGNLLKFARREKMEMAETDVNAVVADTFKLVNHQLGIKGVQVDVELFPQLPLVSGNANQLQQVLLNLCINAGDAMPKGGSVKMHTQPILGPDGRVDVEIRVVDTGTGIPANVKAKIFDPFFTTKEPGKGTGLGLSVSYGIVRDHHGSITVDSEVGKGTTFVVVLPGLEQESKNGPRAASGVAAKAAQ